MDLLAKSKSSYAIFAGGMVAGVFLGLFVGTVVLNPNGKGGQQAGGYLAKAGQGVSGKDYEQAFKVVDNSVSWSPLPIKWKHLGPYSEAGVAPVTFTTPVEPYAYGGVSYPLPSPVFGDDTVLRIDLSDIKGTVGVSLVNPNGDPLVTQEQGVTGADGKRSVFIKVRAQDLPASILFRNYGDTTGNKGGVTVSQVSYAPVTAFSDQQMDALNKMGLNKGLIK